MTLVVWVLDSADLDLVRRWTADDLLPNIAAPWKNSWTSPVGGLAEIVIQEETGLRVPSGEPDAIALALQRLLGHKELAETMGARARLRAARHFSMDSHVDRTRDLCQRVKR
jgi:hypothetical protein